jgi:acyl carrier protein
MTSLDDDTSPETCAKWDSLHAMRLVSEIEDTFGVELATREIMAMDSIGAARSVLKKKGVPAI